MNCVVYKLQLNKTVKYVCVSQCISSSFLLLKKNKNKNPEAVSLHQQQTSPAPKSLFLYDISSQEIVELLGEMANSKAGIVILKKKIFF